MNGLCVLGVGWNYQGELDEHVLRAKQHGHWRHIQRHTRTHAQTLSSPVPTLHSPEQAHRPCLHQLTTYTCLGSPAPCPSWRHLNLVPSVCTSLYLCASPDLLPCSLGCQPSPAWSTIPTRGTFVHLHHSSPVPSSPAPCPHHHVVVFCTSTCRAALPR